MLPEPVDDILLLRPDCAGIAGNRLIGRQLAVVGDNIVKRAKSCHLESMKMEFGTLRSRRQGSEGNPVKAAKSMPVKTVPGDRNQRGNVIMSKYPLQPTQRIYAGEKPIPVQIVAECNNGASARSGKSKCLDTYWTMRKLPYVESLTNKRPEDYPLWGIPFAIKDNIDLVQES